MSRTVIRRLALDGDEVEFDAGQELLREDHIGYWFFLVTAGTARATRHRHVVDHIGPGGHFGDAAILGFRPQPNTVVAGSPLRAWVFGRRQFLGFAYSERLVQQRLYPGVDAAGFAAKVRELRDVGTMEWRALSERPEWRQALLTSPLRELRPGRTVSRPALSLLPFVPFVSRRASAPPVDITLGWRGRLVVGSVAVTGFALVGLLYHPPVVVVDAGDPIDVTRDIAVTGAPTYAINGRYVLLPVHLSRPSAFATLLAVARHRTHVPLAPGQSRTQRAEASREATAAFHQSQVDALNAAALAAHLDARVVHATFRRRAVGGPSAGLIYALAVYDLMTPGDEARGRTVVATGSIDAQGGVGAIGFIRDKGTTARRLKADVFVVPSSQQGDVAGTGRVVGVERLADAIRSLAVA